MAWMSALRTALGGNPPAPARIDFPKPLPVILVAPNMRAAQLWCYEHHLRPSDFYIVIMADRLRGVGPDRDLIWVHGPPWWDAREHQRVCEYLDIIRHRYGFKSERHVYV